MVTIAPEVMQQLVGTDDEPGLLDQYEVRASVLDNGKPFVAWYCGRDHGDAGKGHLGLIARDLDGDQTGLTIGELVDAVLTHEHEEH